MNSTSEMPTDHGSDPPPPDIGLAAELFAALDRGTRDVHGVTRASYGEGEQLAHDMVRAVARDAGLEIGLDHAGNLSMTLPGAKRHIPEIIVGSHLDSVPMGGNFDGAAGVLSGLAIAVAWRRAGFRLDRDLRILAIRGEESTDWFGESFVGSSAALGQLPATALDRLRVDTGRTLAQHMTELGLRPDTVRAGTALLDVDGIHAYVEVHIEQGPALVDLSQPVAVVTGLRGLVGYPAIRVRGEYAHAGATPRKQRRDAVVGAADLVMSLQTEWEALEQAGHDLVCTAGIFSTDPAHHAFSKISGEASLSMDIRSDCSHTLDQVLERFTTIASRVARLRDVTIELGPLTRTAPTTMDPRLREALTQACTHLNVPCVTLASGALHDAAVFAGAGVPCAMLFIRNENGSHNPREAMTIADFDAATRVLAESLVRIDRLP